MGTIALYGGSFNPPGLHHRRTVAELTRYFDQVLIVPCGPRPDKPATNDTRTVDRAVLADLTFMGLPNVRVELFDLEQKTFTRAWRLEELFAAEGDIWHVVGADFIRGGQFGKSLIHREWERGSAMWTRSRFVVLQPPDQSIDPLDLPPMHRVVRIDHVGSSLEIRTRVFRHEPIDQLVVPRANEYIHRRGLYRGVPPGRESRFRLSALRLHVVSDPRPHSLAVAERFQPFACADPSLIVAIGGDGTMLHAIRENWRLRVPFFGINTGHLGFLLNEEPDSPLGSTELVIYQLPLLWVRTESMDGEVTEMLAFNDAWVERASGQTAWVQVLVNGKERLPKVVADGVLMATAAGSTAYARAMGAPPMPFNAPLLILAGSNVLQPVNWRPALLPMDSEIELIALDAGKRPLHAFVDGVPRGRVQSMRVRVSRTAAAELAFTVAHDPVAKLARIQFPT